MLKLEIVIPAAGLGKAMKKKGPKPLVKLGNETVLSRQIRLLTAAFPDSRITVVLGHQAEDVRETLPDNVRVVVNHQYATTGVGESVRLGMRVGQRKLPALIVYGDIVFSPEALSFPMGRSCVIVDDEYSSQVVGCTVLGGKVVNFSFGLPTAWSGICLLRPAEKALFLEIAALPNHSRFLASEILNEVIARGGNFAACMPKGMKLARIDAARDVPAAVAITS